MGLRSKFCLSFLGVSGAVAQLVERDNRTVEARGSIPLSSTPVAFRRPSNSQEWVTHADAQPVLNVVAPP